MNSTLAPQTRLICDRISKSATIRLKAGIEEVFPLFGPVRERDWEYGWDPEVLYSQSPLVEEKMIFRSHGVDGNYIWVVTKYEPDRHLVEYTVHTPQRIWFITVSCSDDNGETLAKVTYTYTALTESGIALNQQALQSMFRHDLKDWEAAINHYLATGEALRPDQASLT